MHWGSGQDFMGYHNYIIITSPARLAIMMKHQIPHNYSNDDHVKDILFWALKRQYFYKTNAILFNQTQISGKSEIIKYPNGHTDVPVPCYSVIQEP